MFLRIGENVDIFFVLILEKSLMPEVQSWLYFYTISQQVLVFLPTLVKYLFYQLLQALTFLFKGHTEVIMVMFDVICLRMSYIIGPMTLELGWELKQAARKKLIEQSFKASHHRNYRMPRIMVDGQTQSIDEIPNVYNLYTQNSQKKHINLLPLKQLIQIKSKFHASSSNGAKNSGMIDLQNERWGEDVSRTRIHRTLSKNSSHMQVKQLSRRSWWCCIKEQHLQQFETKQLTISDDWRYHKLKSTLLNKNASNLLRLEHN